MRASKKEEEVNFKIKERKERPQSVPQSWHALILISSRFDLLRQGKKKEIPLKFMRLNI